MCVKVITRTNQAKRINKMNTYEIRFNGEITKVRTSKPTHAVATVAKKYSVHYREVRDTGEMRIVTKASTGNFGRIY